jgi:hypothetical protein
VTFIGSTPAFSIASGRAEREARLAARGYPRFTVDIALPTTDSRVLDLANPRIDEGNPAPESFTAIEEIYAGGAAITAAGRDFVHAVRASLRAAVGTPYAWQPA